MADDLLAIGLSEDGAGEDDAAALSPEPGQHHQQGGNKPDKHHQSEEAFQELKAHYRPRVENGEIWKSIKFPPAGPTVSKMETQEILHAVEELYFFRRYAEGAALARDVLERDGRVGGDNGAGAGRLDADTKALLARYGEKCLRKGEARG